MKLSIKEPHLIIAGLFILVIFFWYFQSSNQPHISETFLQIQNSIPTQTGRNLFLKQSEGLTKSVDPELVDLDRQIISCSPNVDSLLSDSPSIGGSCTGPSSSLTDVKGKFLGGQCCGAMKDTKEYHEQLEKLEKYSTIPDIPLDPYKTPIDIAKKWIDYDKNTQLTPEQQVIYDSALKLSKEGPCCCRCWHYYVNSGTAKNLIKDHNFGAQQVADFWDVSDICGV